MPKGAHTPGPYMADLNSGRIREPGGECVAQVFEPDNPGPCEFELTLCLFTAAPDMREALKYAKIFFEYRFSEQALKATDSPAAVTYRAIRAALAKAEGCT